VKYTAAVTSELTPQQWEPDTQGSRSNLKTSLATM
jgi:hypothetical protein